MIQSENGLNHYAFTQADLPAVNALKQAFGFHLEKLTRLDKIRLRLALASWQTYLEADNKRLPIHYYLQNSDVCPEAEAWVLFEKIAPQVWRFIDVMAPCSPAIIDPLMQCLSYQLSEGIAKRA